MLAFVTGPVLVIGVVVGVVLLIVVVAIVMSRRKSGPSAGGETAPKPVEDAPGVGNAGAFVAASTGGPAPVTSPSPESQSQPEPDTAKGTSNKPPTLEVEALSPSATGEAPMLGAETGEMKMATDELPKMGTSEMPALSESNGPALSDAPTAYRTQAAKDLSKAIETGDCPKCKASTFVGSEDAEEVGADGIAMYKLTGRCGACGHRAELIDMKA